MMIVSNVSSNIFSSRIHVFDIIDSTSQWLINQAFERPAICIAHEQTHARGRREKVWQAPRGNLALSCSFPANIFGPFEQGLSLVIALAVRSALERFAQNVQVKWPNDLLVNGQKCAGILLQIERWQERPYVVIGIGINNRHAPHEPSTSLYQQTNKAIDNQQLAATVIDHLTDFLVCNHKKGFQHFHKQWLQHDLWYGQQVQLILESSSIAGEHLGIDGLGRILVGDATQSTAYTSGQVSLRHSNVS